MLKALKNAAQENGRGDERIAAEDKSERKRRRSGRQKEEEREKEKEVLSNKQVKVNGSEGD